MNPDAKRHGGPRSRRSSADGEYSSVKPSKRCYVVFDYIYNTNLATLQYPSFFAMCRMKVRACWSLSVYGWF